MIFFEALANYKRYRKSRKNVFEAIEEISQRIDFPLLTEIECIKSSNAVLDSKPMNSIYVIMETGSERFQEKRRRIYEFIQEHGYSNWAGRFVSNYDSAEVDQQLKEDYEKISLYKKNDSRVNVNEESNTVFYDLIKKHSNNWCSIYREVDMSDDKENKIYEYDNYYFTDSQIDRMQRYLHKLARKGK